MSGICSVHSPETTDPDCAACNAVTDTGPTHALANAKAWLADPENRQKVLDRMAAARREAQERRREQAKVFTCRCPEFCYYHTRMTI